MAGIVYTKLVNALKGIGVDVSQTQGSNVQKLFTKNMFFDLIKNRSDAPPVTSFDDNSSYSPKGVVQDLRLIFSFLSGWGFMTLYFFLFFTFKFFQQFFTAHNYFYIKKLKPI